MRALCVIALFAAGAALVGCGSSSTTAPGRNPLGPYSQKDLDSVADRFAMKEGDRTAPGEVPLKFIDLNGKEVNLADYRDKKNVVLVVVKGMPRTPGGAFCPGCLAQLNSLKTNYDKFVARSAEVVVVFPGPSEVLPKYLKDSLVADDTGKADLKFPLVTDSDLKAVTALGIAGDWARPSTYILNKRGDVVFTYVGPHGTTTDRPSVQALLEQLDTLNAKK